MEGHKWPLWNKFERADGIGVGQATAASTVEVSVLNSGAINGGELHLEENVEPVTMEAVDSRRGVYEDVVNRSLHTAWQEGIGSSHGDGVKDVPKSEGIVGLGDIVMIHHDEVLDLGTLQESGAYELTDLPFILRVYSKGQSVEGHDEGGHWDRERDYEDGEGVRNEDSPLEEEV